MQVFSNKIHKVRLPVVEGKLYIIDMFSGPAAGPFDTAQEATKEKNGWNIAEDCYVGECKAVDVNAGKYMFGRDRVNVDVG
jgi:hypothetical protein